MSARSIASRALAAACLLAAGDAHALTSCNVVSAGLAFGSLSALASAPRDSSGSIGVACVASSLPLAPVPYTLSIGVSSTSGNFARALAGPFGATLGYQLYSDAARSIAWGNGSGGYAAVNGSVTPLALLVPASATHTVYGRIPGGQSPRPGLYGDSVLVTIDY